MELHAAGLERIGHRATVLLAEDISGVEGLRSLRMPGARTLFALRNRYFRERPDIINVHTQCAPAWIAARTAQKVSSAIVVMSYSADEPQLEWHQPRDLFRWARIALPARLTFRRAQGIWCVNQQDVEYYVSTYGVQRRRIGRFPHAVADSFYESSPQPSERNFNRLLFVGTWLRRKGIDVLSAALNRVVSARPDVEIVIAGTLLGAEQVLSTLDAAVAARTRVVPRADDAELRELYKTSGLLLIPSRREGLPITMLEAMACGCPSLAAANSGMLDVIVPDVNGWLEVSFDEAQWAARIIELVNDHRRLAIASEGAVATSPEFHVGSVASRVAEWYAHLQ